MRDDAFRIVPRGSFSWPSAYAVLNRFCPLAHVRSGSEAEAHLSLLADGDFAPIRVTLAWKHGALEGRVDDAARRDSALRQVARMFSLDHDGTGWDAILARVAPLGALARALPGLRPVCFSSPYEAACWAVVSQRISKEQAARVVGGIVAAHGGFPHPERMLHLERADGLSVVKVERLRGIAAAALDGTLDAEHLRALGDDAAPAMLRRLPGIGPFWSSGIYLRACGIRDVFPDEPLSAAALRAVFGQDDVTSSFRPFRMWACFLLRVAQARGLIPPASGEVLRRAGAPVRARPAPGARGAFARAGGTRTGRRTA